MQVNQNIFLISTIIVIIYGIYMNFYSISKYIFFINLGYYFIKYILPLIYAQNTAKNLEQQNIQSKINQLESKQNNSIYLTRFKFSGIQLYLSHIIFGYYSYFFDFINLFCLTISFFQIYDHNDYRSFIPLSIFSTLYSVYYVYTVSKLIKEQNCINNKQFKNTKISHIKRGNIVELSCSDEIPADILILSHDLHTATNELQLTGENIVVNKNSLFSEYSDELLDKGIIEINLRKNSGFIDYKGKKYKYNENNIVFRGTQLIDGNLKGLVIEIGNDCMIYNIDNKIIKEKTWLYKKVNNITFDNLYYLLILATILSGALKYVYPEHKLIILIKSVILLLNTIVPLSLQSFYNASTWILSNQLQKENNMIINNHGTHCFQNDPKYIVTDKTGTITKNKLKLLQVINVEQLDSIKITDISHIPTINNFKDIISCSTINVHSISKKLLKNDEMEYLLLEWCITNCNININNNNYNDSDENLSYYSYNYNNTNESVKKLYYKSFDYKIGIKYCITLENNEYILNIQGTPENINIYTNNLVNNGEKQLCNTNKNTYRRIISYAKKQLTETEYNEFKINFDIVPLLNNFKYTNIYVFEDQIVENLNSSFEFLLNKNKNITILTGDRFSSSIEVGKILNMCDSLYSIDTLDDFINFKIKDHNSVMINGRILDSLLCNNYSAKLKQIVTNKNKIIIYRASPEIKEKYIQFIKLNDKNNQVMMLGDGSNDIAAIMKANIGVSIIGESMQIQNISDVVIDSWNKVPKLFDSFNAKKEIIEHNVKWVLSKHILTATILLSMMLMTFFNQTKDPTNPYYMLLFNGLLFVYMALFSMNSKLRLCNNNINKKNYSRCISESIINGLIIGCIVFSIFNIEMGILIALILQFIYLLLIL